MESTSSHDLDFIEEGLVPRRQVAAAMASLGFKPQGRHFVHPATAFFVAFPAGPLMIGNERIEKVKEKRVSTGRLRLLSSTDCVKDRLAAFFHWNDRQSLEQAVLVASAHRITMSAIQQWADGEGHPEKFDEFERRLRRRRRGHTR